jgi:Beta-ketoacyl synthase, N-terminal domain/Acyl-CoA dehydrogenase, C-terminal domain
MIRQGKPEDKHGIRASNTAALFLDDVYVPVDRLIGGVEGQGLAQAQAVFGYTRLMVGSFGLGAGWAVLERAIRYGQTRIQGGAPLSTKQAYTHKLLVPNAVRLEAALKAATDGLRWARCCRMRRTRERSGTISSASAIASPTSRPNIGASPATTTPTQLRRTRPIARSAAGYAALPSTGSASASRRASPPRWTSQQWAVTIAAEALADYGYPDRPLNTENTGAILGTAMGGELHYQTNLRGPNFITDAACASTFAAVGAAVELLAQRQCDAVITGGVDRNMGAPSFVKFCKLIRARGAAEAACR